VDLGDLCRCWWLDRIGIREQKDWQSQASAIVSSGFGDRWDKTDPNLSNVECQRLKPPLMMQSPPARTGKLISLRRQTLHH
jgi:hypothetical protein